MARTRFIDLPRHRRSEAVIRLKNWIRNGENAPSKRFWTWDDWMSHIHAGEQCIDLLFPGRDRFTYWNACFYTTRCAQDFIIDEMAVWETERLISAEDRALDAASPWHRSKPYQEKVGNHFETWFQLEMLPRPNLASLGGLTWSEHSKHVAERIRTQCPPKIDEEFWVRRHYSNGIGLFAIIDADMLDLTIIERTIDRFFSLGEVSLLPRGRSQFRLAKEVPVML